MPNLADILDRHEIAVRELHEANLALIAIGRAMAKEAAARAGDEDEWSRMPGKGERCRISNWSRSKLNHLIEQGKVRKQRSAGCAFYSGTDVRREVSGGDPV